MAKSSMNLGDAARTETSRETPLKQLAAGLPSSHKAKVESWREAPRTQLPFSNVPVPAKEAFDEQARINGMGAKEFLFHCLRAGGVELPEYAEMFRKRRAQK